MMTGVVDLEYLDIIEDRPYIVHCPDKNIIRRQKENLQGIQVVGVKPVKNVDEFHHFSSPQNVSNKINY
jgi:hypothetical protein